MHIRCQFNKIVSIQRSNDNHLLLICLLSSWKCLSTIATHFFNSSLLHADTEKWLDIFNQDLQDHKLENPFHVLHSCVQYVHDSYHLWDQVLKSTTLVYNIVKECCTYTYIFVVNMNMPSALSLAIPFSTVRYWTTKENHLISFFICSMSLQTEKYVCIINNTFKRSKNLHY